MYVQVDLSKCDICGKCIEACPENAISRDGDLVSIDVSRCTLCKRCVDVCPLNAIVEVNDLLPTPVQLEVPIDEKESMQIRLGNVMRKDDLRTILTGALSALLDVVIRKLGHAQQKRDARPSRFSSADSSNKKHNHNRHRRHGNR